MDSGQLYAEARARCGAILQRLARGYEADPELRPDGQDCVRWTGLRPDEFCLLVWRNGDIEAIEPPPELAEKMSALADRLDATVATADKLLETYIAKRKPRDGPTHRDPLTWQIFAYGFSAMALLLAAIVVMMVTR